VVLDSLTGYLNAMPDDTYLLPQLHELLAYLAQNGVVTILVATQHWLVGTMTSQVRRTRARVRHVRRGRAHRAPSVSVVERELIGSGYGLVAALGQRANVTLLERPVNARAMVRAIESALRSRRRQYEARDLVEALGRERDLAESSSRARRRTG
jgi:hypothetical protein